MSLVDIYTVKPVSSDLHWERHRQGVGLHIVTLSKGHENQSCITQGNRLDRCHIRQVAPYFQFTGVMILHKSITVKPV